MSSGQDDQDIVLPEQLAVGREKRSTAGNRMRQLLEQELEKDELFEEIENDVDFQEAKDEHDIVDSDFDQDSPDEGAYEDEDDVEERAIEAQEKAEKRAFKAKTGPAALKKASFMRPPTARPPPPATSKSTSTSTSQRPTRTNKRISFAPDGSISNDPSSSSSSSKRIRTSSRKATVKSKLETQSKMKQEEERRAQLPVRVQPKKKPRLTQDALIAEALEMEEINRENLKWFLEQEEEKKKSLRNFNKNVIKGPFIRWQSVGLDRFGNKLGEINDDDNFDEYGNLIEQAPVPGVNPAPAPIASTSTSSTATATLPNASTSTTTTAPSSSTQMIPSPYSTTTPSTSSLNAPTLDPVFAARAEAIAQKNADQALELQRASNVSIAAELRIEANSRSYVSIHDLPPDSNWVDEYNALLGDHCSWDSIAMVPTRNRPLRPKRSICPITGLPANYKDPRSGIAFANKEAYQTLTEVLDNRFIWTGSNASNNASQEVDASESLVAAGGNALNFGAYVGKEDDVGAGLILKNARLQAAKNQFNSQNSWRETYTKNTSSSSNLASSSSSHLPPHLQVASTTSVAGPVENQRSGLGFTYGAVGTAPGDESVLLQAAMSLPEGSSRSGARRGLQ